MVCSIFYTPFCIYLARARKIYFFLLKDCLILQLYYQYFNHLFYSSMRELVLKDLLFFSF